MIYTYLNTIPSSRTLTTFSNISGLHIAGRGFNCRKAAFMGCFLHRSHHDFGLALLSFKTMHRIIAAGGRQADLWHEATRRSTAWNTHYIASVIATARETASASLCALLSSLFARTLASGAE